ncbi:LamG domain-containing protein [Olivibacter jilunii]|uniref:LamG domain-containing protein n=1 Tax=Olivibacter jilunii TaxID=985016 RepID=UPI003F18DF6B
MKNFTYSTFVAFVALSLISSCGKIDVAIPVNDIEAGLVYYFPFSGNSIDEVSQQSFDTHGASFENDRLGNPNSSLSLTQNYMNINAGFSDSAGTLSFWVNVRDFDETGMLFNNTDPYLSAGEYQLALTPAGEITTWCDYKWGFGENSDGDIDFLPLKTAPIITTGNWYHLVIRWSNVKEQIEIYVNNQKQLTAPYVPNWQTSSNSGKFYVTTLGLTWINPGSHQELIPRYFHGKLDEIRRYNRWINDSEIGELYQ